MDYRKIRFMTALSGLAFAVSMSPAAAQEETFAPFQLEVTQPMLFGQADSAFLQGGISDTIRGALLKTIQQKNGPRAKPSYAPRYEILQPRIAPDLSGQLAIASPQFVPELKARSGGIFDLPLKKFDAQVELQQKANTPLEELKPRVDDHLTPFDLTAKRDNVQSIDLKPRSPSEAPVLTAAIPAPMTIPDVAKDAPIELRQRPREVAELQPVRTNTQNLDLTPKTSKAVELAAAQPRVAMDLTPAKATAVQLQLPPQIEERRETAVELVVPKPIAQPRLEQKLEQKPKVQDELRTKAKLKPAPRIEPMAAQPQSIKIKQTKVKPVKTSQPPQRSRKEEEKIEWDAWYEQVGKLCDERLVKKLEFYDNPPGECTVEITILKSGKVGVRPLGGTNADFISATESAYRSIDGHPWLAFPHGTTRQKVTFQVTSRQSTQGPIVEVDAKRITGDTEIITKTK